MDGDRFRKAKVCFHFQTHGKCRFGDSCKFAHGSGGGVSVSRGRPATFDGTRRREDANGGLNAAPTAPFSMEAARTQLAAQLASNALCSGYSDALVSFSPGQDRVEVLWKGFLMPQDPTNPWELSSQTQALNFLNSGLHALGNDKLASNFVRELGKTDGQGVLLMQDLLDLEYSTDAGRQREVVSFQRGLVAFVTMLTMRHMQMASLHMDEANYVYTYMRTAHVQLFRIYLEQLDDIVDRHSVEDRRLSAADFLDDCHGRKFAPLCFTQLCLPFIRLLYLLGNKFQDLVYEDSFKGAVDKVGAMADEWITGQESGDYDAEDADAPLDSKLCFKFMKEEVVRLHKMVHRGDRNMETAAALKKKAQQMARWNPNQPAPEPWDVIEVGIPEEVVLSDGTVGPRHDNDHREISKIQLLPTTEECLTPEPPLLPGNFPFHANAHWLPPGPERWVDTHFRLFREDLCGTIRTCLQDLGQRLVETRGGLTGGRLRDSDVDYNVYPVVKAEMVLRHTNSGPERDRERRLQRHGLCLDVSFPHPTTAQMSGKKAVKTTKKNEASTRRGLWEKTGWLPYNGMVALVKYADGAMQVVFCHIVERDPDRLVQDVSEVTLQPFEMGDFATLERWQSFASLQQEQRQNRPCMLLLEFNKVFLVAYEPVLRALQSLQPAEMPFLEYLAPEAPHEGEATMEAPLYCYKEEFRFDLGAALRAGNGVAAGRLMLNPLDERNRAGCEAALVRYSTLERDQAKALVRALSSRVACIQGLPGSGKSFIGTLLTQIIVEAKVAPVLVVCYTNHALDQFLCNLLDIGITSLVRVGGQCKEPRLEKYNLSKLPKTFLRYELKLLYEKLDRDAALIAQASRDLSADSRQPTWKSLKWFLETNYPDHFDYFEERRADIYADGWDVAGCADILDYWLQGQDGAPARRRNAMRGRSNVWQWSVEERHVAVVEWDGNMRASRVEKLVAAQEDYRETLKKLETVKNQTDVTLLQSVQIIGMTTTGVAKNQHKIAAVAPRVVICEEAGEVLEAQLMACLSPSCQQLVLIGDHKQLRPHIAEYNLSVESSVGQRFALDVSLFERLVAPTSGLPWWVLTEQHRMRPQISHLLRMQFYPELRDAKETKEYPPLLGVDKNVYFITHDHPEDNAAGAPGATARSHSNAYEVAYLVATLRYLLQQGYHTSDIAILTPYVSQLIKLRSALRGQFVLELNELDQAEIERFDADEGEEDDYDDEKIAHGSPGQLAATKTELLGAIRVATVDNFQGEEATVILVSLVRSSKNPQRSGTIGFLKTPNRVNVLLSRAKHGMLLVGHGELLRAKSTIWRGVLDQLQSDDCYGNGLPLHCQRHPNDHRVAANPDAFARLAPDGGCLRPCGTRLPRCGHACPKLCHTDQPTHAAIYCTQSCPRLQDGCGHICPGICGDPCGPCQCPVGTIKLRCGHAYPNARCFEAKNPAMLQCKQWVEKFVPACGHNQRVTCSTKHVKCTRKCAAALPCGHGCTRNCSDCINDTLKALKDEPEPDFPITPTEHGPCRKECGRILPCCHPCRGICHGKAPCPPCDHVCDVFRCAHGACNHPCRDPCAACTEPCDWSCEHYGVCSLPCGAPCSRRLCDERCAKSLPCGHQCPSVCGEECPSQEFCHECGDEDIKERVADVLLFQTYGELDPSEDPVLVMPCCSMVYTMATLDGTLHLSEYYTDNGKVRGALPGEFIDIPQCPNCKQPIRGLRRYGRVTKRAAIDAAEKKFITHSQRQLAALQERVNLATDHEDPAQIKALRHDLRTFGAKVKRPPCQKAYEACVALLTKAKGGRGGGDVEIDESALPVPNTTFPYPGYFSLLSAQLSLIGASASLGRAEQYARQALEHFERSSFSQQKCEAQLILVQILIMSAEKKLEDTVKTEEERKKRQTAVGVFTDKAVDLFNALAKVRSPAFRSKHQQDLRAFREKLLSIISRAQSATFYQKVSKEEMRLIKMAMQTEFRGSGHWYRCVNGHSYSIGECGMAMEETRCPECGARVGGANHRFVEGTELDAEMDSLRVD